MARDVPGGPAAGARLRPRRDGGADDRRARDDNARDDNVRDDNDSKDRIGVRGCQSGRRSSVVGRRPRVMRPSSAVGRRRSSVCRSIAGSL